MRVKQKLYEIAGQARNDEQQARNDENAITKYEENEVEIKFFIILRKNVCIYDY
ncbi:MAG: hypothetical protein LBL74_06015 [Bacteroidales bacterium]|nr:hypothetical protein [Bacteroidales bacterium]